MDVLLGRGWGKAMSNVFSDGEEVFQGWWWLWSRPCLRGGVQSSVMIISPRNKESPPRAQKVTMCSTSVVSNFYFLLDRVPYGNTVPEKPFPGMFFAEISERTATSESVFLTAAAVEPSDRKWWQIVWKCVVPAQMWFGWVSASSETAITLLWQT